MISNFFWRASLHSCRLTEHLFVSFLICCSLLTVKRQQSMSFLSRESKKTRNEATEQHLISGPPNCMFSALTTWPPASYNGVQLNCKIESMAKIKKMLFTFAKLSQLTYQLKFHLNSTKIFDIT